MLLAMLIWENVQVCGAHVMILHLGTITASLYLISLSAPFDATIDLNIPFEDFDFSGESSPDWTSLESFCQSQVGLGVP